MAISLSQTPTGDAALAFAPEELDRVRGAIADLYGAIRAPWISKGDLGFGDESFVLDDKSAVLRLVSLSPKGAEMLKVLAEKLA